MLDQSCDLSDFLEWQKSKSLLFLIEPSEVLSEVRVYPFSLISGVKFNLGLNVPVSAIGGVIKTGLKVEFQDLQYEVVNIDFEGALGITYEKIFGELMISQSKSIGPKTAIEEKEDLVVRPLRDWCGWHWPKPGRDM